MQCLLHTNNSIFSMENFRVFITSTENICTLSDSYYIFISFLTIRIMGQHIFFCMNITVVNPTFKKKTNILKLKL